MSGQYKVAPLCEALLSRAAAITTGKFSSCRGLGWRRIASHFDQIAPPLAGNQSRRRGNAAGLVQVHTRGG